MSNHSFLPSDDQNPDFIGANNPDNRLHVVFHKKAVQNNFMSEKEGRPIYDDADMVTIHVPGDQLTAVTAFVREDHKRRFPQQWAMFQNQMSGDQRLAGKTPLEHWPRLTLAQVAELKHMKFLSVEDIAHASDTALQGIGMCGGMSPFAFRDVAARFLKLAADEAVIAKSDAALNAVKDENAALREQMASFERRFAELAAAQAPAAGPSPIEQLAADNAAAEVAGKQSKRTPAAAA